MLVRSLFVCPPGFRPRRNPTLASVHASRLPRERSPGTPRPYIAGIHTRIFIPSRPERSFMVLNILRVAFITLFIAVTLLYVLTFQTESLHKGVPAEYYNLILPIALGVALVLVAL